MQLLKKITIYVMRKSRLLYIYTSRYNNNISLLIYLRSIYYFLLLYTQSENSTIITYIYSQS